VLGVVVVGPGPPWASRAAVSAWCTKLMSTSGVFVFWPLVPDCAFEAVVLSCERWIVSSVPKRPGLHSESLR